MQTITQKFRKSCSFYQFSFATIIKKKPCKNPGWTIRYLYAIQPPR